jgi:phosphomevalonate kinase
MNSIIVKKPGKLYLSGEYAVVKGYHAIILPSKWMLEVSIHAQDHFSINSDQFKEKITFQVHDYKIDYPYALWKHTLQSIYRYLKYIRVPLKPHHIQITSELHKDEKKWGLGSSGALTIALIDAVLQFHSIHFKPLELYKLGVVTQRDLMEKSSFGDLAMSAFQEPLLYKKFNPKKLSQPLYQDVQKEWDDLIIHPIELRELPILIVHTNQTASSYKLVSTVFSSKENIELLEEINRITLRIYDVVQSTQYDQLYPLMREHHHVLLKLKVKKPLYTHNMQDIISHIEVPEIGFKFSGAGGGDNMMIATTRDKIHQVLSEIPNSYPIINNYIKGVIHVE